MVQVSLTSVTRVLSFLGALMLLATGLTSVIDNYANAAPCQNGACVGPGLRWSYNPNGDFTTGNTNTPWRAIFSLGPNTFIWIWTSVILGLISTLAHFPGFDFRWVTGTWVNVCLWNVFAALFGAFGYAGNLGVITGFLLSLVAILAFVISQTPDAAQATSMGFQVHFSCGNCGVSELVLVVARLMSFACAVFTLVTGLIHVFGNSLGTWCGGGQAACVGPGLIWNQDPVSFIAEFNAAGRWRGVFTLAPDIFCVLWGPIIIGCIAIMQHLSGREWPSISGNWGRSCLWHLFLGAFCNAGYAGSWGVLVMFFCAFTALLAFIIVMLGASDTSTHLAIVVSRVWLPVWRLWGRRRRRGRGRRLAAFVDSTPRARA